MTTKLIAGAALAAALVLGSAGLAQATPKPVTLPNCAPGDVSPAATACEGFFSGNLLNSANVGAVQTDLSLIGFTWDGTTIVDTLSNLKGATAIDLDGGTALTGNIYIGIHFGAGKGSGGPGTESTAFYELNGGVTGLSSITLAYGASSDAVVYSGTPYTNTNNPPPPGVPEPATWSMMILGFGAVGGSLRRRKGVALA